MSIEKNIQEKTRLHLRNKNREKYDLEALAIAIPELSEHIKPNKYGENSVDFANPVAVKLLNKALLKHYYGIENWDFPDGNLCPPIPGRADYLHYIADLLTQSNFGTLAEGHQISVLDIGVGANCIYPIVGVTEYSWSFIGSDINPDSIEAAKKIADARVEEPEEDLTKESLPGARGGKYKGVTIHSVRLPGYVAHQEVLFGGYGELLTLRHDSLDRKSFMPGVMMACRKVMTTDGFVYGLENYLE